MTSKRGKSWNVWAAVFALISVVLWLARPARLPRDPPRPPADTARPRPPPQEDRRKTETRPASSDSPWTSREGCEAALARGLARRAAGQFAAGGDRAVTGQIRLGSWNLHWFPDGVPGKGEPSDRGADIRWLACAVALLDVDVLAIQEVKTLPRARARLDELVDEVARATHRRYRVALDPCDNESGQHVGFLYDSERATPGTFHVYASLNPLGEPCKDQLRPGFGAHFRFSGGLDAHLISVHAKSGSERRAYELRRRAIDGIAQAYREAQALAPDSDVIVLGDFNTMGCAHCSPSIEPVAEMASMAADLDALSPAFRLVAQSGQCSEYSSGRATLLDQFVVTRRLNGLPADRRAHVSGLCEDTGCRRVGSDSMLPAAASLSDHCPILLELDASAG